MLVETLSTVGAQPELRVAKAAGPGSGDLSQKEERPDPSSAWAWGVSDPL